MQVQATVEVLAQEPTPWEFPASSTIVGVSGGTVIVLVGGGVFGPFAVSKLPVSTTGSSDVFPGVFHRAFLLSPPA